MLTLKNHLRKITFEPKSSKDDLLLNKTNTITCQICFNIIWDKVTLECPNDKCFKIEDKSICIECSNLMFSKCKECNDDFTCPFCRSIIITKEEYSPLRSYENNTNENAISNTVESIYIDIENNEENIRNKWTIGRKKIVCFFLIVVFVIAYFLGLRLLL